MDFARQQRDPKRHLVGFTFVVLLHVLVVYALMTGLAKQAVEVIKKPMTATIIQEIKPPPPPPPPPPRRIELPKMAAPVKPYVPPPDVPPPAPPPPAPTITVATPTPPPPQPYVIAPPPPPAPPAVVVAPPAPPKPAIRRGITPVQRVDPEYPRAAIRAGVEKGRVLARVNIDEQGNVTAVNIVSAEPPRVFNQSVTDALMQWKFKAEGEKYVGEIEVTFTLKD